MRIAICMIVKNEEKCLDKCLQSLEGVGDIYILDTGSTDKTVEIARKYTDKVFEDYKWNDSMCEARNHILDKCDADWILSIDADEQLITSNLIPIAVKDAEEKGFKTVNVIMESEKVANQHMFPRLFKKGCRWKGAIHNYLNVSENNNSQIKIIYGYSDAHKKDPDRSFRILKKEVMKPGMVRELFYLAREYWYRKDYIHAIMWYEKYLQVAVWAPEMADAYLMMAKCYKNLNKYNESTENALKAIRINNDYKEALEFMADMSGPKNSERWLNFAYNAKNQDVLFINNSSEQGRDYYNRLYMNHDPARYVHMYKRIGEMVKGYNILDCGCGTADLSKYIEEGRYKGFDFSEEAIKNAVSPNVYVGDIYDINIDNYNNGQELDTGKPKHSYTKDTVFVFCEVLEHIEDLEVLNNLPSGSTIVATIPSFADASHIRRYTRQIVIDRYKDLIDIKSIERFNWHGRVWRKDLPDTKDHITLFIGVKK